MDYQHQLQALDMEHDRYDQGKGGRGVSLHCGKHRGEHEVKSNQGGDRPGGIGNGLAQVRDAPGVA